jgi:hypothetical protein
MKLYTIITVVLLLLTSCRGSTFDEKKDQSGAQAVANQTKPSNLAQDYNKVVVEEVIQVKGYTYLGVREGNESKWLSVPTMQAEVGEEYYYRGGTPMRNFVSKSLNRTFESILFLEEIKRDPTETSVAKNSQGVSQSADLTNIEVPTVKGGITLKELMTNKEKYAEQEVTISGLVVKYNEAIMRTNWIHIQDGSGEEGEFDLTVTSSARVSVGETVVVKGIVILNKDFGAGYTYEIIIENADVSVVKKG